MIQYFKIFLPVLFGILLFTGFSGSRQKSQTNPAVFIKDSSKYSHSFIQKLTQSNYAKDYKLVDSFLILDNRDTFKFPEYTKPGRRKLFIALGYKNTDSMFDIHLQQLNYTNIKIEINILDRNQNNFKKLQTIRGIAELNPYFFLGKKEEKAPRTGEMYWSDSYSFKENNCEYTVLLGKKSPYMIGVKFECECKNKSKNILAADNPQFEEK